MPEPSPIRPAGMPGLHFHARTNDSCRPQRQPAHAPGRANLPYRCTSPLGGGARPGPFHLGGAGPFARFASTSKSPRSLMSGGARARASCACQIDTGAPPAGRPFVAHTARVCEAPPRFAALAALALWATEDSASCRTCVWWRIQISRERQFMTKLRPMS